DPGRRHRAAQRRGPGQPDRPAAHAAVAGRGGLHAPDDRARPDARHPGPGHHAVREQLRLPERRQPAGAAAGQGAGAVPLWRAGDLRTRRRRPGAGRRSAGACLVAKLGVSRGPLLRAGGRTPGRMTMPALAQPRNAPSLPSVRRRQCMLAALCLCIAGPGTAAPAAADSAGPAALDTAVREAARQFMREQDIPGLAVGWSIDGQARLYHYGVASKATHQPVTGDTLFEIGSISKTFTVTLAAYAQAAGKLSLRDATARHVPELAGSRFGEVPLLHLATHTAGGFPLQVPDHIQDTAQLFDYLRTWQPRYPAGARRTYANPSIGMLGVAAARSLGQPYRDAAAALFGQLGLSSTYIAVPAAAMGRYAQGYNRQDAPVRLNPAVLADEAYGVKTSARDLLRFV